MIKYNNDKMNQFKNDYQKYNEEIIESLKRINNEFMNVDEILQTPKSTKEIPKIIEFMKSEIDKKENELTINIDKINYILSTYNETFKNISTMIGDKNV